MPTKQSPGYVYFVQAVPIGLIKIGWSLKPKDRMMALRGASPLPLELLGVKEGSQDDESRIHGMFASARSHGEWFHPVDDVMRYIKTWASLQPLMTPSERIQAAIAENEKLTADFRRRSEIQARWRARQRANGTWLPPAEEDLLGGKTPIRRRGNGRAG